MANVLKVLCPVGGWGVGGTRSGSSGSGRVKEPKRIGTRASTPANAVVNNLSTLKVAAGGCCCCMLAMSTPHKSSVYHFLLFWRGDSWRWWCQGRRISGMKEQGEREEGRRMSSWRRWKMMIKRSRERRGGGWGWGMRMGEDRGKEALSAYPAVSWLWRAHVTARLLLCHIHFVHYYY